MSSLLNGGYFDQNDECDAEFNEMVKEAERKIAKEKTKKKKGNQKKSSFDELLAFQKQQVEMQREQNKSYEKMMRETLEEQRKSDKEERDRDQEFFLEVNNMPIFFRKAINGYVLICECAF